MKKSANALTHAVAALMFAIAAAAPAAADTEKTVSKPEHPTSIGALDYTVIYVRDMNAMKAFYGETMGFRLVRELSSNWIEYGIGPNILALARRHPLVAGDAPVPAGSASLQIAFRVPVPEVDVWAAHLSRKGVTAVSPPTDQPW